MKKFRNRIAAITAVSFAATFAVATTPAQAEDVTLKLVMAAYTDEMVPYYAGLEKAFEAANPGIDVQVDVVAWPEIGQKVKTLIASGQSPDIVNNDEFAGEAAAGLLYRADEIVSAEVLKDIVPAFVNNSKYKGTALAVPDLASARGFAWNKKLIAGAGIKKAPTTWPEMLAAAKAVKKKYPDVYPYCLPLGPEEAQMIFTTWGGVNGGRLFNEKSNKYTLNNAKFKGGLDFLKSLVDQKLTQPNPGKTNRTDGCWTLFAKGKVAMVDGAVFFPGWLKENGGGSIDVAQGPFPHAPGQKSVTVGVQDYFKGYKANGRQVEIQKFLTFLFEPTNYQGFLKAAGTFIPATKSAAKLFENDPVIAPFSKLLPNAIFYPGTVGSWQACKAAIVTYMGNAMSNTGKALQQMQAKCDAAHKKVK